MEIVNENKTLVQATSEHDGNTVNHHKTPYSPEELLTDPQATEFLGLSRGTLTQWRHRGIGPRFIKLGSSVRYQFSDIQEYLEQQKSN